VTNDQCVHCKVNIDQYSVPGADGLKGTSGQMLLNETVTCNISFRDQQDKIIALPASYTISARVNSKQIYETISRSFYAACEYPEEIAIYYTNIRGDQCSRCQLNQCPGCRVPEGFEIELKQYDNFKVITSTKFDQIRNRDSQSQTEYKINRPKLQTCLEMFATPEQLEENSVSCQKCNQQTGASKKLSVQKWPETLIIYLKRFVYLNDPMPQAKKIETEIIFPLDDLDLSQLTTENSPNQPAKYSLVGSIQHFGGMSSGHYISYARHPVTNKWNQYNDNSTKLLEPSENDARSVYILFYRSNVSTLPPPELFKNLDIRTNEEIAIDDTAVSESDHQIGELPDIADHLDNIGIYISNKNEHGLGYYPDEESNSSKKIRTSPVLGCVPGCNPALADRQVPSGSPNSLEVDRSSQESLDLDEFRDDLTGHDFGHDGFTQHSRTELLDQDTDNTNY
jgi:hypothetical protein